MNLDDAIALETQGLGIEIAKNGDHFYKTVQPKNSKIKESADGDSIFERASKNTLED